MNDAIARSSLSRWLRHAQQLSRCARTLSACRSLASPSRKSSNSSSAGCQPKWNQFFLRLLLIYILSNAFDRAPQKGGDRGNPNAQHFANLPIAQALRAQKQAMALLWRKLRQRDAQTLVSFTRQ